MKKTAIDITAAALRLSILISTVLITSAPAVWAQGTDAVVSGNVLDGSGAIIPSATITALNINEVVPLARTLQEIGACQLKLHCLRPVGNACDHPELFVADPAGYIRLREQLRDARLGIEVVLDEDLSTQGASAVRAPEVGVREIERIEADPRGALTMSCKAVGKDSHAFWYDKTASRIIHRPSATDELTLAVPDVIYTHV